MRTEGEIFIKILRSFNASEGPKTSETETPETPKTKIPKTKIPKTKAPKTEIPLSVTELSLAESGINPFAKPENNVTDTLVHCKD